jgi:hypothetical protein
VPDWHLCLKDSATVQHSSASVRQYVSSGTTKRLLAGDFFAVNSAEIGHIPYRASLIFELETPLPAERERRAAQ